MCGGSSNELRRARQMSGRIVSVCCAFFTGVLGLCRRRAALRIQVCSRRISVVLRAPPAEPCKTTSVHTGLDRLVMHFTHMKNLRGIIEDGLESDTRLAKAGRNVVECADREIKSSRRRMPVQVDPGGVVADYVPFYFAPRSPMMYRIWKGGVDGYADGIDPLVYLVTSIRSVERAGSTLGRQRR